MIAVNGKDGFDGLYENSGLVAEVPGRTRGTTTVFKVLEFLGKLAHSISYDPEGGHTRYTVRLARKINKEERTFEGCGITMEEAAANALRSAGVLVYRPVPKKAVIQHRWMTTANNSRSVSHRLH